MLRAGARYRQAAHELHDSRQGGGTVTVLHFDRMVDVPELTVCRRRDTPWTSSQTRPPTADEVRGITDAALAPFDAPCAQRHDR
jgi:hypothetical protein